MKLSNLVSLATPYHATPTRATQPPPAAESYQEGGAIGAAIGASLGRPAFPIAAAGLAAHFVGNSFGPLAGWGAGVVSLLAAGGAEYQWKVGRVLGGMVGGVTGAALGSVAGALGHKPKGAMAEATAEFSLKRLPQVLRDTENSSQKLACFKPEAVEAFEHLQPGDIIAVQGESTFGLAARLQKLGGFSGDWTHAGMVTQEGKIIEIIGGPNVREQDRQNFLYEDHVMVLRPHYANPETRAKTIENLRNYLPSEDWTHPRPGAKHADYDDWLNLKSDDKQYCTEFIYKAMQQEAPEINIQPAKRLGIPFVTVDQFRDNPNVETVFSTGSNFWINQVSRFV